MTSDLEHPRSMRKAVSNNGLNCGYYTYFLSSSRAFGSLLWSPYRLPKCWPETNRIQIFLQQSWVYLGSAENCRSGSATMVSHMQIPSQQGKENPFIDRKGSWEGYSKQRVHGFSLAESLSGKKRSLSSSCWALLSSQSMGAPLPGLLILFHCGFCSFFTTEATLGSKLQQKMNKIIFSPLFFNSTGKSKAMMPECVPNNLVIFNSQVLHKDATHIFRGINSESK